MNKRNVTIDARGITINNLYHPVSSSTPETMSQVTVLHLFLAHDFLHIALKEWFFMVRGGGQLSIDYAPSDQSSFDSLEKTIRWLCKGNYVIVSHEASRAKNRIVIQKLHNQLDSSDAMTKWTFGIVTNGDRNDWLEQIITSIRNQKIPQYEIIVCGKTDLFKKKKEKDIIHIPFNERSDRGWITRKKNLIGQQARYENMCVLHDRLVLDKDWYKGMKKYGNAFELLGCVQIEKDTGEQAGDWLTNGGPVNAHWKVSRMRYDDWDYYTYLSGQLTIIKRKIWKEILWDETRYWNDAEDADISFRSRDAGYIVRFNPHASMTALSWRHGKLPLKYSMQEGLLPKDMILRRVMRTSIRAINRIPYLRSVVLGSFGKIASSKIYKHFIYH